ncbi:DUF805 domain-containing protein [Acetobacteraceae bacterium]|nr:DUF805 domain-containing protein [Acetobacteraceae bacterium]
MKQLNSFDYFLLALKNYARFSGRASRSQYWYFHLFNFLFAFAFYPLAVLAGVADHLLFEQSSICTLFVLVLNWVYTLGVLIPAIAVSVRRLHDTNRSGWWFLLGCTIIGLIPLIIFYCQRSDLGEKRFGVVPDRDLEELEPVVVINEDNFEKIEKLAALRDKGILTEEEFQRKKLELL